MKEKEYTVVTSFGTYKDIILEKKCYYNGSTAITMTSRSEGPFATLTVNLCDKQLPKDFAFVDTNNCPWAEKFIADNKLGEPTGNMQSSGWCEYPLYKFDLEKIN